MNQGLLLLSPFCSLFLFPWPLTVLLTLVAAWREPLMALAVGLAADALYYSSTAVPTAPLATLGGLGVSSLFFFVQRRLVSGMMG